MASFVTFRLNKCHIVQPDMNTKTLTLDVVNEEQFVRCTKMMALSCFLAIFFSPILLSYIFCANISKKYFQIFINCKHLQIARTIFLIDHINVFLLLEWSVVFTLYPVATILMFFFSGRVNRFSAHLFPCHGASTCDYSNSSALSEYLGILLKTWMMKSHRNKLKKIFWF